MVVRQVRHDRDPGEGPGPRPGRLARGLAAGHRQLRLAPQRRDRHDGDGRASRPSGICTTRTTAATAWTTPPSTRSVGANAIFYSDAAVNPGNPSGAASLSWDPDDVYCRPYYNYANPLVDRFLIYRLYWDETSLRLTVVDDGVEHDLLRRPRSPSTSESDEFQQPFYLIANLAIGGAFTDAYNLGDPGSGLPVSMPFPAEMYVDYIRVYEWNGQGEVHLGPPAPQSRHRSASTPTRRPPTAASRPRSPRRSTCGKAPSSTASIPPYEGDNVLSWQTTGLGWFGAGIMSIQPLNLFDFGDGHLKFRIKIPANVTFKIGIIDAWNNQYYVAFPAYQTTYGLVRDGEWGQASIPVSDIRGTAIDLRMLSYAFVILEENGTACEFALDDIYWDAGVGLGRRRRRLAAGPPARAAAERAEPVQRHDRDPLRPAGGAALRDRDLRRGRAPGDRTSAGSARPGSTRCAGTAATTRGANVGSGVYYYRLRTDGGVESRKMVLVK